MYYLDLQLLIPIPQIIQHEDEPLVLSQKHRNLVIEQTEEEIQTLDREILETNMTHAVDIPRYIQLL